MTINVLIVDDSSFMRKALTHIISSDDYIRVIDTASDGRDAIQKVKLLNPDVVLLDIEMPIMDGITALSHIMSDNPLPIVILSGIKDANITMKCLELGAVDFIPKPSGVISYDIERVKNEIIYKIKIAAKSKIKTLKYKKHFAPLHISKRKEIIVIGASTGGPRAIINIISEFPIYIPVPIIIVQHMDEHFIPSFAERLRAINPNISIAKDGDIIDPGKIFVAPGGYHTMIVEDGYRDSIVKKIRLVYKFLHTDICPCIDYTMESVANIFNGAIIGVLLTGVGNDGAIGMKTIKSVGGNTIAEDESTCVIFGMPKAAIELGSVDKIVPLQDIPRTIMEML